MLCSICIGFKKGEIWCPGHTQKQDILKPGWILNLVSPFYFAAIGTTQASWDLPQVALSVERTRGGFSHLAGPGSVPATSPISAESLRPLVLWGSLVASLVNSWKQATSWAILLTCSHTCSRKRWSECFHMHSTSLRTEITTTGKSGAKKIILYYKGACFDSSKSGSRLGKSGFSSKSRELHKPSEHMVIANLVVVPKLVSISLVIMLQFKDWSFCFFTVKSRVLHCTRYFPWEKYFWQPRARLLPWR